nr:hypothetical protein GCM10020092_031690 [Actinoplanes digitatis]
MPGHLLGRVAAAVQQLGGGLVCAQPTGHRQVGLGRGPHRRMREARTPGTGDQTKLAQRAQPGDHVDGVRPGEPADQFGLRLLAEHGDGTGDRAHRVALPGEQARQPIAQLRRYRVADVAGVLGVRWDSGAEHVRGQRGEQQRAARRGRVAGDGERVVDRRADRTAQ